MNLKTILLRIQGVVQGVGFRPFVYQVAQRHGICGYVRNDLQGVFICAQGTEDTLERFKEDLKCAPKAARILSFESESVQTKEIYRDFSIQKSLQGTDVIEATIPADIALCEECLKELRDPQNRRYDRESTSMAHFIMCKKCKEEYHNPRSRRFHSEINCCKDCGPKLLWTQNLESFKDLQEMVDSAIPITENLCENPLQNAILALKNGAILALKGIGGYALICNACNSDTIVRLRKLKQRPRKPFALMCRDLKMAESFVELSAIEREMLASQIAPIVLAEAKNSIALPTQEIAPNLTTLGVILPYAPLHYLLFSKLDFPLIFTSANVSGEPIIKDFYRIVQEFSGICDGVLWYDRDILNPIDDSLMRIIGGKIQVLRRARGFLCDLQDMNLNREKKEDFIAFGAQQKATFCLKIQNKILLSPHLGDLDTLASVQNFAETRNLFCGQYKRNPQEFVLDLHPQYAQRSFVEHENSENVKEVQHHFAHLLSNIAENSLQGTVLGVIFDGTGFGNDGKIWGGEFLVWDSNNPLEFSRIAHFDDFPLLGGERALMEIGRLALALLFGAFGREYRDSGVLMLREFSAEIQEVFYKIKDKQVLCHSVGRLFDAISALCGVCLSVSYEGEGGMLLESLAQQAKNQMSYSFAIAEGQIIWSEMIREICDDLKCGVLPNQIARNFHYTLARIIKEIAQPFKQIALSGGCFQNALLTQFVLEELWDKEVYLHSSIPCNDGGISFGQAYYALQS